MTFRLDYVGDPYASNLCSRPLGDKLFFTMQNCLLRIAGGGLCKPCTDCEGLQPG